VAERVQREPTRRGDARPLHGGTEGIADVTIVEAAPGPVAEDEIVRPLVRGGEPMLAQLFGDRGGEHNLASAAWSLEGAVYAVAGELAVDANHAGVVDEIGPSEAERFDDPEAGVGEELEQRPVALRRAASTWESCSPSRIATCFGVQWGFSPDSSLAHGEAEDLAEGSDHVADWSMANERARSDWPFGRVERLLGPSSRR
jgi:hypothetical protein